MIDDLYGKLSDLREWCREQIRGAVYSVARFTYMAATSADGTKDGVLGQVAITDNERKDEQESVRRLAGAWGLWSVPPTKEPALVVRAGGGATNGVIVACGGPRYAPANMATGDVALFNTKSGVQVYLKASDGSVTITDSAGGAVKCDGAGNVVLNGGTLGVARQTDTITGTAGPYPVSGTISGGSATVKSG